MSGLSDMTATSPVGVPPLPVTPALRVTAVPWANEAEEVVRVVVVAVPLLRLFHLVTSTVASIEPRPVARSYPGPAAYPVNSPLVQLGEPAWQGIWLVPSVTSWNAVGSFAARGYSS